MRKILQGFSQRLIVLWTTRFIVYSSQKGQALITLLFFVVIGVAIISSAVVVLFAGSLSTTTTQQGQVAYYAAEAGAEDGYLYLLRNPKYKDTITPAFTETITVDTGVQAQVTVNNSVVKSVGSTNNGAIVRIVQVTTNYSNGQFTVASWSEVDH